MSVHRYHPDPARDDPPAAILFDDRERCASHAEQLVSLDAKNLAVLLDVNHSGAWNHRPTETERRAANNLWRVLLVMERLTGKDWRVLCGAEVSA